MSFWMKYSFAQKCCSRWCAPSSLKMIIAKNRRELFIFEKFKFFSKTIQSNLKNFRFHHWQSRSHPSTNHSWSFFSTSSRWSWKTRGTLFESTSIFKFFFERFSICVNDIVSISNSKRTNIRSFVTFCNIFFASLFVWIFASKVFMSKRISRPRNDEKCIRSITSVWISIC